MSNDLIAEWCDYHHNLNNISNGRRVLQLRVLRELEATLSVPVEQIDSNGLEHYMVGLVGRYHPHTIVRNLALIRPFLRWLWHSGRIDADRWLRLQAVRGPRGAYDGLPRPYTASEIRRFWLDLDERYPWTLDHSPQQRTPARGEYWVRRWADGHSRWKRVYPYARRLQVEAVCSLALYGGLRRDEIYGIGLDDMHYDSEYVRVVSRKGPEAREKVRVVAMNKPMALAIGNWLEFRSQVLEPPHDFPWLCLWAGGGANNSEVTAPMSHTQFQYLIGKIGGGYELHRLRHTFATERYRAGMPIEILQVTLGHATIAQTLGYAKIDADRILSASRASDDDFLKAVQNGRSNPTQEAA